ncbi:MAG TPA: response regulator, partial [Polyangiaceae bacterium]
MLETSANERKKVMIIDDSEIVLAVARCALESAGFEVVTHPRPAGCIALILQEMPDLLLIDVNMPGLNGDTVVKMLGATQVNSTMVVLLYSSLQDDVLIQKVKVSRAHGYIRKSESAQDLVREVSRWIRPGVAGGVHSLGQISLGSDRTSSGNMLASARSSDSQQMAEAKVDVAFLASKKLLLVDNDIVALSEYRHLTKSLSGTVEYALSGTEALRRVHSDRPPDVMVLGTLKGSPDIDEILGKVLRLGPGWKSRCIVLDDESS